MLLQFSVRNYRSFKDQAVLSMEASTDTNLLDNISVQNILGRGTRILRSAVLFGANASGKSNLFKALTSAILTIRMSGSMQPNQPLHLLVPFVPDPDYRNKPTEFEFVFLAEGKKYVYGFSATREKVYREYLYVYNTAKASVIFERDINWDKEYRFTSPAIRRELEPLTGMNTPNKLFISTATIWNSRTTKAPYMWFASSIDVYPNNYKGLLPRFGADLIREDGNGELKRFIMDRMREADVSIDDYQVDSKEYTNEQVVQLFQPEFQGIISAVAPERNIMYQIMTKHHALKENGDMNDYVLDMDDESNGTQNAFMLSPLLLKTFREGNVLCIDEFDASFHPLLVIYLVSLFHNPEINTNHAQLIISSHTMELMSQNYYRRDQIYYVQKDNNTASSELYSLDEFSPRTTEDIRKAYLAGRFGSLPLISEVM